MVVPGRSFRADLLVPTGGDIYCHIFENNETGVRRNLFWSVTIDFEQPHYGEDEFACSLTCEWIPWQVRNWRELDGRRLDVRYGDQGIESSFYMGDHHIATSTNLRLRHRRENLFMVTVEMLVDFHGYYGGDENSAMPVRATADVPFIGLLVIPDNLRPKPNTEAELRSVASAFVDLRAYVGPEPWRQHGFIFRPST